MNIRLITNTEISQISQMIATEVVALATEIGRLVASLADKCIQNLVNNSLIIPTRESSDVCTRFQLHGPGECS